MCGGGGQHLKHLAFFGGGGKEKLNLNFTTSNLFPQLNPTQANHQSSSLNQSSHKYAVKSEGEKEVKKAGSHRAQVSQIVRALQIRYNVTQKKNPQIDQLGTLFHLCFFPFSPPQCFPEAFLFCSKAVFLTKKCGFLNPQSSHPQPLMGDPNHSIEGLQSLIDLPNATQKNQHNEFTGSRRLDRGHLWEKNRLTFFYLRQWGLLWKVFFYDRSGFHKTFFTTHFFTAECFPQKLYQTEMLGIAIRIFFLDFCQNSESWIQRLYTLSCLS